MATYFNEHRNISIDVLALQRDQKLINDMYKTKLMLMGLRGENIKTATS